MASLDTLLDRVGSLSQLARDLSITPQAIDGWKRRGKVPAERVLDVERVTGGLITRYELRPDIYVEEASVAA